MFSPSTCLVCKRSFDSNPTTSLCPECFRATQNPGSTALSPSHYQPFTVQIDGVLNSSSTLPIYQRVDENGHPLPESPTGLELIRQLGTGGMGTVYLAQDNTADQLVAIKFLHRPGSIEACQRFLLEWRAFSRLNHPNIVRVHGCDFLRTNPYFTMEYLAGGSLAKSLEQYGTSDPLQAARLMAAVARAVHAAHQADLLHRDIKPSNILLTKDGTPKISDFGLAKRTNCDDDLTITGGPVGTPTYMAPEQANNSLASVGPRSDVYGLGATLYHLLTGRAPFRGTPLDVLDKLQNQRPQPLKSIRSEIPAALEAIVLKCLEKSPEGRYSSAEALADDLDRFTQGMPTVARPLTAWSRTTRTIQTTRKRATRTAIACLLFLGAFVVGAGPSSNSSGSAVPVYESILDSMRKDLAAGKAVTLVGKNGFPQYHRFLLEPNQIGLTADRYATFHSFGFCMLELFPDPGIDRYRVSFELRQLQSMLAAPGEDGPGWVGFYFGHASGPCLDKSHKHVMYGVQYIDYPSIEQSKQLAHGPLEGRMDFQAIVFHESVEPNVPRVRMGVSYQVKWDIIPERTLPGQWRRFELTVTPQEMQLCWIDEKGRSQLVVSWDAKRMKDAAAGYSHRVKRSFLKADATLEEWSPRMPFGVLSMMAAMNFRNVVITPLP